MLKSLLVAIDETAASQTAQALAVDLAGRLNAEVKGLAVLDKPWIDQPRAQPIGGGHYHQHRKESLNRTMGEKLRILVDAFNRRCKEAGVAFQLVEKSGAPVGTIELEAQGTDLILVGKDTTFHFAGHTGPSDTVMRLIRDDPRPTVITAADNPPDGGILIAYDGSLAASRALHIFVLLGLGKDRDITLLCVDEDREAAEQHIGRANALLQNHGLAAKTVCEVTSAHPAKAILAHAHDKSMVVMGAFGRNHLRDYFFGSTTQKLIDHCEVPLFIFH